MERREKVFTTLYDEYADAIFRYLYLRLGDREKALELTHDVFARVWEYLAHNGSIAHPKAFLYRSARNAFINTIRIKARTTSLDALAENGFEIAYSDTEREQVHMQEEALALLKSLDDASREIMILRYIEGMSVKEIAKVLDEKENTISVRIKRSIEKLKQTHES